MHVSGSNGSVPAIRAPNQPARMPGLTLYSPCRSDRLCFSDLRDQRADDPQPNRNRGALIPRRKQHQQRINPVSSISASSSNRAARNRPPPGKRPGAPGCHRHRASCRRGGIGPARSIPAGPSLQRKTGQARPRRRARLGPAGEHPRITVRPSLTGFSPALIPLVIAPARFSSRWVGLVLKLASGRDCVVYLLRQMDWQGT